MKKCNDKNMGQKEKESVKMMCVREKVANEKSTTTGHVTQLNTTKDFRTQLSK